jgi:hypothetical protein
MSGKKCFMSKKFFQRDPWLHSACAVRCLSLVFLSGGSDKDSADRISAAQEAPAAAATALGQTSQTGQTWSNWSNLSCCWCCLLSAVSFEV